MKNKIIGIDIGGTKISCVLATDKGKILKKEVIVTTGPKKSLDKIIAIIKTFPLRSIRGIGVGSPGPLDPIKGIILNTPNMRSWHNFNVKQYLRQHFKMPIVMDNDANAAGLGEKIFGAGKKAKNIFYFTVSTGVGGGLILDGKIHQGASFDAAEAGHMVILQNGPKCGCGKKGCLEALSSGPAIAKRAKAQGLKLKTAKEVVDAAKAGNKKALKIVEEAAYYLGIGVANIMNVINPDMIVIGGGVSQAGNLLFKTVRKIAKKESFGQTYKVCPIVPAKLGAHSGDLGAVSLVLQRK